MTGVAMRVDPAALGAASSSLRARPPEQSPVDATLLTERALGSSAVAAALAEYVALRAERQAELAAHLAAVADALDHVRDRVAGTEHDARAGLLASIDPSSTGRRSG